ncbi:cytochrome b561 domain-containing protein [Favolaschia claudopus]|uniref:Cytochrome b561 domain-containing protein n=1 Tax=Favolaschia claudopus TaxID=2862362 RepID=A0AAW0AQ50_9AGAR
MPPFRLSPLLLLLWVQSLFLVRAASVGDSGCNLFFCLNITITHDVMTFEVTPVFEPFGWVGLGFGRQMKGTHMVVLWENEDSSKILSQRYGVGHVEPVLEPSPPRIATMVSPTVGIGESLAHTHTNYSTTTFQIPVNKTDPRPGQIIWAYSLRRPEPEPSSDLTGHYVAGTVNMRFQKTVPDFPGVLTETEESYEPLPRHQKLIWHGILLSVGFLVVLPTGSLVARWGRTFTPRWFKAHRLINFGIALPTIAAGFILGPLAVLDRQATHFADAHQICGVLLFAVYIGQLFMGRYIHARRDVEGRSPHPPANILHAVLGISIVVGAFLQVRSGFGEWSMKTGQPDVSRWCHDLLAAWSLILPILYLGGLALLKRQFVQEQQQGRTYDDSPEGKNYIALAAAPSPMMFESEHEPHMAAYSELESGVPLLHRVAV